MSPFDPKTEMTDALIAVSESPAFLFENRLN